MPLNSGPPDAGVLNGLLVVDFTQAIAGPVVTRVLAEMGARVVKTTLAEIQRFSILRAVANQVIVAAPLVALVFLLGLNR